MNRLSVTCSPPTRAFILQCLVAAFPVAALLSPPAHSESNADNAFLDLSLKQLMDTSVTMTGSFVPTPPDAVAVPVTVLSADQIEQGGVNSNLLEILRKAIPSIAGRSNIGNSNANNNAQNTAGGSRILLNNLDTLVLVNGRRVANSGINAVKGKEFVDVNQIPAAAIERIEVLSDGASALYGSEAIGGVINIILKNSGEIEVGTRYGAAVGNYSEKSGYFSGGTDVNGLKFSVTGSSSKTSPLYQNTRSFTSPLVNQSGSLPGTVGANGLNPGAILANGLNSPSQLNGTGLAAIHPSVNDLIANGTYDATTPAAVKSRYDVSQFQTLLLGQDQDSLVASLSKDLLGKKLVVFGDVMYSKTKSHTQYLPVTTTITVPAGSPYNPLTTDFANVRVGSLSNPLQYDNDATGTRVTAGLSGELDNHWNWEAGFVHSEQSLTQKQRNVISSLNLPLAIAGGYDAQGVAVAGGAYSRVFSDASPTGTYAFQPALDPFALAGTAASLANVFGTARIDVGSKLDSVDAKLIGTMFDMPAGKSGFATGVSFRKESESANLDPNSYNTAGASPKSWIGGPSNDPFNQSRTVSAVFAEVRLPIASSKWSLPGFHALDLIGAVRGEKYSDVGNSTAPKLGFRWQPVDSQVTLRGTFSKSFTAPTLIDEFGPTDTRIAGAAVIHSVYGDLNGTTFHGEDGNNPQLKPSQANSRYLGIVLKPKDIPGLTVGVDYASVSQSGTPGGIGFNNILKSVDALGAVSPYANRVTTGNFYGLPGAAPFTAPGQLGQYIHANAGDPINLYVIDSFVNLGGIKVELIRANAEYEIPTDQRGTFTLGTQGAMFRSYQVQAINTQPFYEFAGTTSSGGGAQGSLPKYRFYSTLNWKYKKWDAFLGNTYISSVNDIGAGGASASAPIKVDSYITFDLRVAYTEDTPSPWFRGWTVAVGINNVTDHMPPLARSFTDNNADVSTYGPIGRMVYTSASIRF